ncbi:MAG: M3 family peptidase, partial [Opitutus sp.]
MNPLLDPSFHIRWSAITPELIEPSIGEALDRAQASIDAIASLLLDQVTFDNTFLQLERATDELTQAWGKVTHLQSVADSPELRAAHNVMLPRVSAFYSRIPLNAELWQRLKAFAESKAAGELTRIQQRFFNETVADFRQAGADLGSEQRTRLEVLQTELSQLTQKYSENVLDATNAWQLIVDDEARLKGLPGHARASARRSAMSKGVQGWRFT